MMNKAVAIICIVVLSVGLFGSAGASADLSVVLQDTADPRTPPSTPTSGGDGNFVPTAAEVDYSCPVGLPAQFGTLTPGALWNMICASCIPSPTVWPTYDFNEVVPTRTFTYCENNPGVCPTSTVTNTPGPTATGTVTPTPYSVCQPPPTATSFPTSTPDPTATYVQGAELVVENTETSVLQYFSFNWLTEACTQCADNSASYNDTLNNYVRLTKFTDHFDVFFKRAGNRGIAEIFLDDVSQGTVDLYTTPADLWEWNTGTISWGVHSIKIVVTDTRHPSSTGDFVVVDRIESANVTANTATPQPTATPVFGMVDCESAGTGYTCNQDLTQYAKMTFSGNGPGAGGARTIQFNLFPASVEQQISYRISIDHTENSNFASNRLRDFITVTTSGAGDCAGYGEVLTVGPGTSLHGEWDVYDFTTCEVHPSNNNLIFRLNTAADWPVSSSSLEFVVEVWAYIQCELLPVTATPGATPGPGYCFSVSTDDFTETDVAFWGASGEVSCIIVPSIDGEAIANISGIVAFLWENFAEAFGFLADGLISPAMTICFQPYDFLDFNFFGIAFAWSWFINLFLVVFVISHFLRR